MDYQRVENGTTSSCGVLSGVIFGGVYLIYALFVETDKTCYSDGVSWSTSPDSNGLYEDVAYDFSVVFWGLGITCILNSLFGITKSLLAAKQANALIALYFYI